MSTGTLCRICLKRDSKPKKMRILTEDLLHKIEELSGIEMRLHSEYPKMLCSQCKEMLDVSSKFREMCLSSENALLELIIKPEPKIEPPDFDDKVSLKSDNDGFFEDFIGGREVIDISEIADFNTEDVGIDHNDDDSIEHIASESESILSLIEGEAENNQRRKQRNNKKIPLQIKREKTKRIVAATPQIKKEPGKRGRRKLEDSQSIMCEICGNIYKQKNLLNMHMRRHMEDKPFECEICKKRFACPSEIRRHMRTHTGERPYVCKYCGRSFTDRSTNIKHERIHTNTRPFSCKTCGKSFTYSNVLKNHMLTHTGEKPFSCLACNKTFSRKHQLDQHCATLTHQQIVKCLDNSGVNNNENHLKIEGMGDLLEQEIS